jgi:hypothetical protein
MNDKLLRPLDYITKPQHWYGLESILAEVVSKDEYNGTTRLYDRIEKIGANLYVGHIREEHGE